LKFWQSSLTFWQTPALLKNVRSEQFKQTEWSADQTAHKGSLFVPLDTVALVVLVVLGVMVILGVVVLVTMHAPFLRV
jgi:hypothetical protein